MRVAAFHLLIRLFLIKDETQRSAQTAKLHAVILAENVLANNWPHLHTFVDLWATANELTICSGQVKQLLTKLVSFRVKNSWDLLPPKRLYPKYKARTHFIHILKPQYNVSWHTLSSLEFYTLKETKTLTLLFRIHNTSS